MHPESTTRALLPCMGEEVIAARNITDGGIHREKKIVFSY